MMNNQQTKLINKEFQKLISNITNSNIQQNISTQQEKIQIYLLKKIEQNKQNAYEQFFYEILIVIRKYGLPSLLYFKNILEVTFDKLIKSYKNKKNLRQKIYDLILMYDSNYKKYWKAFNFLQPIRTNMTNLREQKKIIAIKSPIQNLLQLVFEETSQKQTWNNDKIRTEIKKFINKKNLNLFQTYSLEFIELLEEIPTPNKKILQTNVFYKNEQLQQNQNNQIEYKNYNFPIKDQKLIFILKKTICGFLNYKGGTIFIGIAQQKNSRKKIVHGIQLHEDQIQKFSRFLSQEIFAHIFPNIQNKIQVSFKPVKYNGKIEKNLYVNKIRVESGDKGHLYHFYDQKKIACFIRNDNQVIRKFKFEEIYNEIRNRALQLVNK